MYDTLGEKLENNVHDVTFKKVIDHYVLYIDTNSIIRPKS